MWWEQEGLNLAVARVEAAAEEGDSGEEDTGR